MKKSVVIYATCQGRAISGFLKENKAFNERYVINDVLSAPEFVRGLIPLKDIKNRDIIISQADVFIYQPVKDIYNEHSTVFLRKSLKKDCVQISMPFVYNLSTFPLAPIYKRDFAEIYTKEGDQLVLVNKEAIDDLIDKGLKTAEILDLYDSNKMDFYFEKRHRLELAVFANREELLDIKVTDFIRENISEKQLFLFPSHPTSEMFIYMTNQILALLDCPPIYNVYSNDHYGLTSCGFPAAYPMSSVGYFKFKFGTQEGENIANLFYRNLIEQHLKAMNVL
jgi:hypothetical protein